MPPPGYRPRATPGTVLSTLLRDHLDSFLQRVNTANDGGLPVFVERQLRAMIDCGDPSRHSLRSAVTPEPPDPSHVGHPVAPRRPKQRLLDGS